MSDALTRRIAAGALLFGMLAGGLRAQRSLLYLELQAVGAYASASDRFELFSLMAEDVMQKPGIGFDFVQRLSGRTGDIGALAVQARLVYNQYGDRKLQPQLYNAYLRLKPRFANIWVGHNRPALGLSAVLDGHALLLPAPSMLGYGFDRDWGVGLERDFDWGGAAASLTTGSGMPLYLRGNYLAAARVFKGVLARDNHSVGLSFARGNILETMGYTLVDPEPFGWTSVSFDASHVWRNLENRAEVLFGRRRGASMFMLFWRSGLSLLEEGRLKVEIQPVLTKDLSDWHLKLGSGLTYLFDADLAGRFMALFDGRGGGARFAVQLYYYKRL